MKKLIVLMGGMLLAAVAGAQAPPAGGPPNPQARFEHIATELGLSDAQKPKVQKALDDERAELMASMKKEQDEHTDIQVAHQNHEKIEEGMVEKLKPVLSADQVEKFKGLLAAEAAARHHRPAPGAAPAN